MYRVHFALCVCLLFVKSVRLEDFVGSPRDSYLNAYAVTQKLKEKSDINGFYPQDIGDVYNGDSYEESPYYGPPKPEYGPPKLEYGPPKPEYGPPKPIYGPPISYPPPNYGSYPAAPPPPAPSYGLPNVGIPHQFPGIILGIIDKIKYKIELLTIGKILLKLVIFKKVVSFIAIICLLLFLPSLKRKHENNNGGDDLLRSLKEKQLDNDDRINNISSFVMESIEAFRSKQNQTHCRSIYCKTQKIQNYIDTKLTYGRLLELYSQDL